MSVVLKKKKGFKWFTVVRDFKADYLDECKRGRFTQNNTEYFEAKLKEEGLVKLLWATYKIVA